MDDKLVCVRCGEPSVLLHFINGRRVCMDCHTPEEIEKALKALKEIGIDYIPTPKWTEGVN